MRNITFINAGAGSGKTYSLTEKLTENISEGKCRADEVILTTFTELAAGEFKSRARETLLKANLPDQANLLASAAMGTVHSVAYLLIRRYWYLLGLGVDLNVMPEEDVDFFINQSLANIPTENELDGIAQLTRELGFKGEMNRLDENRWKIHLKTIIEAALGNRIEDLGLSTQASLNEVEEIFRPVQVQISGDDLKNILQILLSQLEASAQNDTNEKRIQKVKGFLQLKTFSIQDLFGIKNFLSGLPNKIAQIPVVQQGIQSLAQIHRSRLIADKIRSYIQILFDLAERSIKEFQDYKKDHNIVDFNDMEVYMLELLEKPEIKEELSGRYKMVFVDEFQDSSPIQLQIFIKLSEIVQQSYWVGDPKQAIYNFRGTDPRLIQAMLWAINEDRLSDERRNLVLENLPDSWRSRPGIVSLTNKIFTPALAGQVVDPEHISLDPVRSDDGFGAGNNHIAVQHWHLDDDFPRASNERYHHHLASMVNDTIEGGHIRIASKDKSRISKEKEEPDRVVMHDLVHGDIGILCRTNKSVSSLSDSLNRFGHECAAQKAGFISTAEIQLLLALMNYLLDKYDSLARATILLLGSSGNSPEELLDERLEFLYGKDSVSKPEEEDFEDEDKFRAAYEEYQSFLLKWGADQELLLRTEEIRQRINHFSVPALIEKLVHELALTDLVKRWGQPLQRSSNLQSAIQLACKYSDRCQVLNLPVSLQGFIEYLRGFKEDELKQSAASGKNAINVLTYHKSKGLEWPIVILTDLHSDPLNEDE